ncbi:MAG: universal stress protein [Muribaculaceae bacterium]|nr:universal stress protein [Muribaculaceae bacterium]
MEDKFITLSIHTADHAIALQKILEAHSIEVKLQNYVASGAPIAVAIRVMIHEKDLTMALKVTESLEHLTSLTLDNVLTGHKGELLIPVDFNDYCFNACKTGFELASYLHLQPVLLHAYPTPVFSPSFSLEDTTDLGIDNSLEEEYNEVELSKDLQKQGRKKMKELISRLHEAQKEGTIPDMNFKALMEDGVAEDVIKEFCKVSSPALVVMVTRGKQKKGEQLIGSVTAEVLDDCKVPLLSIPENYSFAHLTHIKEVIYLCNLDQQDLMCVDSFMRMFEYPDVTVTLIPVHDKEDKKIKNKLLHLKDYFNKTYPTAHFITAILPHKNFMADFNNYESQRGTELIVVPNRRKNAFMRLFNPGIAHRLLFERDLPLLALPI